MKNTPVSIVTGLVEDVAKPYLILEMGFTSGTIRLTNLAYNITVDGEEYLSDGGLTEFSPPQLSTVLDREVYKIKLLDHGNFYKGLFESGVTGTPVTVKLGIQGNYEDLDFIYKGVIDATYIEVNASEGIKEAIIECSSPFGTLDRTTDRRTDKNTQRNLDPTDSCFDKIYNKVESTELRWGKKS